MPRTFQINTWVPNSEQVVWFGDAGATEAQWKEFLDEQFSPAQNYEWIVHRFTYNNWEYLKIQHNNSAEGKFDCEIVVPYGSGFCIQYDMYGTLFRASVLGQAYSGGNTMTSTSTQTVEVQS